MVLISDRAPELFTPFEAEATAAILNNSERDGAIILLTAEDILYSESIDFIFTAIHSPNSSSYIEVRDAEDNEVIGTW